MCILIAIIRDKNVTERTMSKISFPLKAAYLIHMKTTPRHLCWCEKEWLPRPQKCCEGMRDTTRLISRTSIVLLLRSFPSFVDRFIGVDFGRINGKKRPQENRAKSRNQGKTTKETGRSQHKTKQNKSRPNGRHNYALLHDHITM